MLYAVIDAVSAFTNSTCKDTLDAVFLATVPLGAAISIRLDYKIRFVEKSTGVYKRQSL